MEQRERIDYDTDPIKHFVRYDGWLEACRLQHRNVQSAIRAGRRKQPFSYFTFCASNAIDVFMLEKAGLLRRDEESGRLNHIYFCEKDDREFEQVVNLIKSDEAGFKGDFKKFVLFEDSEVTLGKDEYDIQEEIPNPRIRESFYHKRLHKRFRNLFPLDVINLDPYGVFFPQHEHKYSAMLKAIERIFDWQQNSQGEDEHRCEKFTLMLTTHLEEDAYLPAAVNELKAAAADNIRRHPEFSEAFKTKFRHIDPYALTSSDFPTFFAVTLPKLIAPIAQRYGWFGQHRKIYTYVRLTRVGAPYYMMSSVVNYERVSSDSSRLPRFWDAVPEAIEQEYVKEMCNILAYKPVDVVQHLDSYPHKKASVVEDLKSIVDYREAFLAANM